MEKVVRVFNSFAEAEAAQDEYYRSLTPKRRLRVLFELVASYEAGRDASETRLQRVAELLNAAGVRYVVAGAYALACHGIPRFTGDIDFFVEPSQDNAKRILGVLRDFGFGALNIGINDLAHPDKVIQLGVEPTRIDLLTSIDAVPFDEAYANRVSMEIDGLPIGFLSREHLIRNKRAATRPQDIADAARLEKLAP